MYLIKKTHQRALGFVLLLLSANFTVFGWVVCAGNRPPVLVALFFAFFPVFAVNGVGLLLFPIDTERLREQLGVKQLEFHDLPPLWKGVVVSALLVGLCYAVVLWFW